MDRGEPFEGLGRISRAIITGSPLDCRRFGGGPEERTSNVPGPDLRLIPELATLDIGTGRLWLWLWLWLWPWSWVWKIGAAGLDRRLSKTSLHCFRVRPVLEVSNLINRPIYRSKSRRCLCVVARYRFAI